MAILRATKWISAPTSSTFYGSAATILAPGMPMDTKGLNLGALVKADILLSTRDTLEGGFRGSALPFERLVAAVPICPAARRYATGGMAPDTFVNIKMASGIVSASSAEWESRWNPRWTSSAGGSQRYGDDEYRNGAGLQQRHDVQWHAFVPRYHLQCQRPPTHRQQLRFDGTEPLYTRSNAGIRGRLRQEDPFAEPLRALRLVDKHDGNGDGQLRRRWQLTILGISA